MQGTNQTQNEQVTFKFFVIPRNGTALLGMIDIELQNVLRIMCNTIDIPPICIEVNAEMMENKCHMNKNSIPNLMAINNKGYIEDAFMPGPNRETEKVASTKITKVIHNEFEGTFTLQVKTEVGHIKNGQDVFAYVLQQLFKELQKQQKLTQIGVEDWKINSMPGPNREADKGTSIKITKVMHNEFGGTLCYYSILHWNGITAWYNLKKHCYC